MFPYCSSSRISQAASQFCRSWKTLSLPKLVRTTPPKEGTKALTKRRPSIPLQSRAELNPTPAQSKVDEHHLLLHVFQFVILMFLWKCLHLPDPKCHFISLVFISIALLSNHLSHLFPISLLSTPHYPLPPSYVYCADPTTYRGIFCFHVHQET